jgi:hypothetical protein
LLHASRFANWPGRRRFNSSTLSSTPTHGAGDGAYQETHKRDSSFAVEAHTTDGRCCIFCPHAMRAHRGSFCVFVLLVALLLDSCAQEVFSKKLIHKDFYNTFDDDCDPDVDQ